MTARGGWALRGGAFALLLLLLWDTALVRPLRVLVVLFHEIFHAAAALLTGGGVTAIRVLSYRSGATGLEGGLPAVVYSAGTIGTALLGSLLLACGHSYPLKRTLYLGLAAVLAAAALLFVRNPFGWAYGLAAAGGFLLLALRERPFSAHAADFIGVLCLVDTFRDLAAFILAPGRSDPMILHEISGIPYPWILAAWILAALVPAGAALSIAWRSRSPERLGRNPQWSDFGRFDRRGAGRRTAMQDELWDAGPARGRRTVAVYLGVLAAILLATLYASRFVLFQPWTARSWAAAAEAGGRIYVAGGRDEQGDAFDPIHRIDPAGPPQAAAAAGPPQAAARIRQVSALPSPRFGVGMAAAGGRLYLLGGCDGRRCFDDLLVYEPAARRLRRLASLPSPRAFGGVAAAAGRLYYLGGWDGEAPTDEILAVDPQTGRAERVGRLPSPREHLAAAALGGRLYCAGGSGARGEHLDEVLEIDPGSGAVLRRGRLPSPRTRLCAAALGEAVYLLGGWDGGRLEEVLRLRPLADPGPAGLAPEPVARIVPGVCDAAAVAAGGALYLLGGTDRRFPRQLRVVRIEPAAGRVFELRLRSFLFW